MFPLFEIITYFIFLPYFEIITYFLFFPLFEINNYFILFPLFEIIMFKPKVLFQLHDTKLLYVFQVSSNTGIQRRQLCLQTLYCQWNLVVPSRYQQVSKQAENGLQSRSSENGKTAVWHYGLKLQ